MGVTCQLVRVRADEMFTIAEDPDVVLDMVHSDAADDRCVDIDQAWPELFEAFQAHERGDDLTTALVPGPPVFDESAEGGQTVMLATPDVVRSAADALDRFSTAGAFATATDPEYLEIHFEGLRGCYRRAATDGEAIAVIIG